mmetsp:Transcript_62050/g.134633  ORF Transcript_62050/g.134633 Transcript_62050/m.134633 type:complete len:210 (+) Transcript_62050:103-732(+)
MPRSSRGGHDGLRVLRQRMRLRPIEMGEAIAFEALTYAVDPREVVSDQLHVLDEVANRARGVRTARMKAAIGLCQDLAHRGYFIDARGLFCCKALGKPLCGREPLLLLLLEGVSQVVDLVVPLAPNSAQLLLHPGGCLAHRVHHRLDIYSPETPLLCQLLLEVFDVALKFGDLALAHGPLRAHGRLKLPHFGLKSSKYAPGALERILSI